MEYNSQLELYQSLIPAFNVKNRLLKNEHANVSNKEIWLYLAKHKWCNANDLTINEMVNDIITFDINLLKQGG